MRSLPAVGPAGGRRDGDAADVQREGPSRTAGMVVPAHGRFWRQTSEARVTRWAAASAALGPVVFIAGFCAATALQPRSYNPVHDTISDLAASGATDPWVMTIGLAGLGLCYLIAAAGLRPARGPGRIALACGGVATLLIAAFRQPRHGYSDWHEGAVVAVSVTMCLWPVLAAHRFHPAPLLSFPPSITGSAVMIGFVLWFALSVHGGHVGLAERCASVACALWVPAVAITALRTPNDSRGPQ